MKPKTKKKVKLKWRKISWEELDNLLLSNAIKKYEKTNTLTIN